MPGGCGAAVVGVCNGSNYSNIHSTLKWAVRSGPGGIVHGYKAKNGNIFAQDDIKVTKRLTMNVGVRWEYNGQLSDKYGNLSNLWVSQLQTVNSPSNLGSSPATGTYAGWTVPNNYDTKTSAPFLPAYCRLPAISPRKGSPDQFRPPPRFCLAAVLQQQTGCPRRRRLLLDRVALGAMSTTVEQSPPYSVVLDQGPARISFPPSRSLSEHSGRRVSPRWFNFATNTGSNLSEQFLQQNAVTPLVYQWNLNSQYQLAPTWIVEVAYVGSRGIHQIDMTTFNGATLASPSAPVNGITVNTTSNAACACAYPWFRKLGDDRIYHQRKH